MTEPLAVEVDVWIRARPETVFAFFTDPEKHRRWMGNRVDLSARRGGGFRIDLTGRSAFVGAYLEVDPPRRLVYTWGWEPNPGEDRASLPVPPGLATLPPGSSRVEVTLVPERDGTRVRVRHTGFPTEPARDLHADGWPVYASRLARAVEGGDPGPDPVVAAILSRLRPSGSGPGPT